MKVIIKPIVTEKQNLQSEKYNRYGFLVAKDANKLQIKKAVEELYNVTVESVNTVLTPGKKQVSLHQSRRGIWTYLLCKKSIGYPQARRYN